MIRYSNLEGDYSLLKGRDPEESLLSTQSPFAIVTAAYEVVARRESNQSSNCHFVRMVRLPATVDGEPSTAK